MAMARPILSACSIIILAGGCLLQILVILSGVVTQHTPINDVFFLQASTSGISGSNPTPNPARWTYFAICGVVNGHNGHCSKIGAAIPFDPVNNFGTQTNVPDSLANKHAQYYYMSRVAWAFYLIAGAFAVGALAMSIFALFSRLAAKFDGIMTACATVFQAVCAALMTYVLLIIDQRFARNND